MLVATPGSTTANSYLNLDAADSMAVIVGLTGWASLTSEAKEAALIRATMDVDTHRFHSPVRYFMTQALSFPREKDLLVIPKPILWACFFQADYIATSGEYDQKKYEGAKGSPLPGAGTGSPLCPRAFAMVEKYISRVASYV